MRKLLIRSIAPAALIGAVAMVAPFLEPVFAAEPVKNAPAPAVDQKEAGTRATAYFAGGCFWGVEGVFAHVKGVISAESGYAGGPPKVTVTYEDVGSGQTGYAEAVKVVYNPQQVSYGTLLRIFFSVIADPTALNYQGPDHGTQYRSALFPLNAEQGEAASAYLAQIGKTRLWRDPIVTRVERFTGWWRYGIEDWLARADTPQSLSFTCELGPPPYAITGADGREISDRWAEALKMKALIRQVWGDCVLVASKS
jgi:peptide-methionine (S)-S-oxide reductase